MSCSDHVRVTLRDGVNILVPASLLSTTTYVVHEQEDWFEDEVAFVQSYLQAGDHVVDVGANYGIYTLHSAMCVGDTGSVTSFEPTPAVVNTLRQSVGEHPQCRSITVEACALSNHQGSARFVSRAEPELNTLANNVELEQTVREEHSSSIIEVKVTTLDAYSQEHGWDKDGSVGHRRLALIKLDAEGEEQNIVRGASTLLSTQSPLIMFEYKHGDTWDLSLPPLFQQLGYQLFRLVPGLNALVPCHLPASPAGLAGTRHDGCIAETRDAYQLNLFAAKSDLAASLTARGLLIPQACGYCADADTDTGAVGGTDCVAVTCRSGVGHGVGSADRTQQHPDVLPPLLSNIAVSNVSGAVLSHFSQFPYAREVASTWALNSTGVEKGTGVATYLQALHLYLESCCPQHDQRVRYECLLHSYRLLTDAPQFLGTPLWPRLITLSRVALDLGRRQVAVEILTQLKDRLPQVAQHDITLPFPAPHPDMERVDPAESRAFPTQARVVVWLASGVLEQLHVSAHYSSCFAPHHVALREVNEALSLGYDRPSLSRRASLLQAREMEAQTKLRQAQAMQQPGQAQVQRQHLEGLLSLQAPTL